MEFAGMIRDPERRSPMLITLLNGICTDAVDVEQLVAARVKPRPAPALA
jgi:hypothetical protein